VRTPASLLFLALAACRPSATVEKTIPVANLQAYQTVGLRVHTNAFASQGLAMMFEASVTQKLQQQCSFTQVTKVASPPQDVVIDLNITKISRGGSGLLTNPNLAEMDTLMVLTDGLDGQLLGTATIRGKSSGMMINNAKPEIEALEIVAKTIAEMFAKSGCSGARVARATPPPVAPDPGTPTTPTTPDPANPNPNPTEPSNPVGDPARLTEAEELNARGREALIVADAKGAQALFQQANAIVKTAKFTYNICVSLIAQNQRDTALTACREARTLNPDPSLSTKIDSQLAILSQK
jgi:hypothetical protein